MAKKRGGDGTSGWLPCGCHILHGSMIVHCAWHQKTQKMAGVLDLIRRYYLQTPGMEACPFVEKIDELIPRKESK
jgi:hypothetical protein